MWLGGLVCTCMSGCAAAAVVGWSGITAGTALPCRVAIVCVKRRVFVQKDDTLSKVGMFGRYPHQLQDDEMTRFLLARNIYFSAPQLISVCVRRALVLTGVNSAAYPQYLYSRQASVTA